MRQQVDSLLGPIVALAITSNWWSLVTPTSALPITTNIAERLEIGMIATIPLTMEAKNVTEHPVRPERITKPIQLLAAWLAGLLAIDTCFLLAASRFPDSSWHASALVIAAIVNVPLFLLAVFLLQTRFRPELQEDSYYSTYLSAKTNEVVKVSLSDSKVASLHEQLAQLEARLSRQTVETVARANEADLSTLTFGVNHHLKDRERIERKLRDLNIPENTVFGDDVVEPPKGRNVSIALSLSPELTLRVIALSKELKFKTYSFIANQESISEDVLFGSYGDGRYRIDNGLEVG
jgi:hypothetical protein